MLFADLNYQNFDWWHDIIPDANEFDLNGDKFEHSGQFNNESLNIGFTIGLNDYWNMTVLQLISKRCMEWEGPVDSNGESLTVHHRSECSSTDFFDMTDPYNIKQIAYGGYLSDTRINFKYLLYNQGKGPGNRLFVGGGFMIPTPYTITESPWLKNDDEEYTPHRHFYLSDGAYKMFAEIQFFKKRVKKPVFVGGTFSFSFPLNKSDYGFKPSNRYELSLVALSGPLKKVKTNYFMLSSIGLNFTMAYAGPSEWNGVRTPNSEAIMYIPGISLLFGSKAGTFGINVQQGHEKYLIKKETDIEERNEIYSISLSYRKVLDKYIDKLYWK